MIKMKKLQIMKLFFLIIVTILLMSSILLSSNTISTKLFLLALVLFVSMFPMVWVFESVDTKIN